VLKNITKSNEFITFLILIVLSLAIGLKTQAFFSLATVFDVLRSSVVYSIIAFGLLPIIISGGIDISFGGIAAVATYATHNFLISRGYDGGTLPYYLIAGSIGLLAGLLNGFIITQFNLPAFNVSLAMMTMWYGFSLFFLGPIIKMNLPAGSANYSTNFIAQVQDPFVGRSGLHVSVFYVIIIGLFIWWLLKYTTVGRGIYAMGGNREVAVRSGFNIKRITLIVFGLLGFLAAIGGVTQSLFLRIFNPAMFVGQELNVLAAVILGGASIAGGRGSVIGTFMGVLLIQLINRSMILTGIPVAWQQFVVGIILIVFISIPYIRSLRNKKSSQVTKLAED
jgi:simple sugar transport system permease protein